MRLVLLLLYHINITKSETKNMMNAKLEINEKSMFPVHINMMNACVFYTLIGSFLLLFTKVAALGLLAC